MSNVIASQRSFAPSTHTRHQPSHLIPSTDYLDLWYDENCKALWIYLSERGPAFISLALINDLAGVDQILANSTLPDRDVARPIDFKIIASKRRGVFSLGGDLARFRYLIDQGNRKALAQYAHAAIDAIWANTQAASVGPLTTVSLVQGEAQGGGFEAALSTHVLVAEKGAMFGFPEALFGMFPGMGGYALLSARAGSDCAKRLIGSTNRYPAEMLYEMGVIDVLADKGKGSQILNDWMRNASPASTFKYRTRFADLDHGKLLESIDEWVQQALDLNQRQLRTMGFILEAQKRASKNPPIATVTPLRKSVGLKDLSVVDLITETANDTPSPLLITPKTAKCSDENEFISFFRNFRPWLCENLSRHGAILLRGFPSTGAASLSRLAAALRTDRAFNASRSIPTPAILHENAFKDDCWLTEAPQALHNAYSDCAIFPAFKILRCNHVDQQLESVITIANTRSIYQHLDGTLVAEFERRGITYRRSFTDINEVGSGAMTEVARIHTWQNIFKTSQKNDVERKCRENGLSYSWRANGSVEIWNSAPACISHRDTGDRLWFNQIHLYKSSAIRFIHRKSLLSKLFSIVKSPMSMDASFSDGTPIPQSAIDEIALVHDRLTLEIQLLAGDFLLLDNALTAQGRHALVSDQPFLMTMY